MAPKVDLKKIVGQLFVAGFNGPSVPADFRKAIQEYHFGGTLLLKGNVESATQLAELTNELQFSSRPKECPPLFITIDHEGGRVNRLLPPFTKFPSMDKLGELGSPKVAFLLGSIMGKELRAVGINVNFAPVVDVATNPNSPALVTRMFSADPEVVAKLGSALCRGLQKAGVAAVAKHFPGHGDAKEDSHFALPKVDKPMSALENCELIPFKRMVRSRSEGIMTAHILNPSLDPKYPATLSKGTVQGILRDQMRYAKIIFSDDMEMKAIWDNYGPEEAAVLAIEAGCDCLIYKGDAGVPIRQMEAVIKAVESNRIPIDRIESSVGRILSCKKTFAQLNTPLDVTTVTNDLGLEDHQYLATCIANKQLPTRLMTEDSEE